MQVISLLVLAGYLSSIGKHWCGVTDLGMANMYIVFKTTELDATEVSLRNKTSRG